MKHKTMLLIYIIFAYTMILTYTGGCDVKAYEGEKHEQYNDAGSSLAGGINREGTAYCIFGKNFKNFGNGKFKTEAGEGYITLPIFRKNLSVKNVYGNNNSFIGDFVVTAYTLREEECGKAPDHPLYGQPAISGSKYANFETVHVKENYTIAADWDVLPPGTAVRIEGLPYTYVVEDKGGAIKGNRIDIYMTDLEDALQWGVQYLKVEILREESNGG